MQVYPLFQEALELIISIIHFKDLHRKSTGASRDMMQSLMAYTETANFRFKTLKSHSLTNLLPNQNKSRINVL